MKKEILNGTRIPYELSVEELSKIIVQRTISFFSGLSTDSNRRKPSSERKGDHEVVEGACATLKFD